MKPVKFGRVLAAVALIGIGTVGVSSNASAQYGGYQMGGGPGMMGGGGGGMMGGYGAGPGRGYQGGEQGRSGLDSRAGQLYAQTCSRCHALPDPRQHSAGQWPGVVARMEGYMRQRGLPLPDDAARKDIDGYLAQQAGGG